MPATRFSPLLLVALGFLVGGVAFWARGRLLGARVRVEESAG